jgi:hypothetical protein
MVDEMLAACLGGLGDRVLRLALGADEQHLAAAGDGLLDEVERAREQRHRLRQIDDVDAVAVAEDVRLHPRVPAVGLVAEMHSGLEQLLQGDDIRRHWSSPSGSASAEPCHRPFGRHRYVSSACGMDAPLAEEAAEVQPLGNARYPGLTARTNRNIVPVPPALHVRPAPTMNRDDFMLGPLLNLLFLACFWIAGSLGLQLLRDSRPDIIAALAWPRGIEAPAP